LIQDIFFFYYRKDEFTIECPSVGRINKILIGHDNKGLGPAWFLDSIIVEDVNEKHVYEFPCNRWLAKNEDDGQISRFLFPKDSAAHGREPTPGKLTFILSKKKFVDYFQISREIMSLPIIVLSRFGSILVFQCLKND